MERYIIFGVAALFTSSLCLAPPSQSQHYRSDYEYNGRTRAFYKLHTESRTGWAATSICKAECAALMNPTSHDDIVQLHGMFKKFPDLGEYVWVAPDGQTHESAEEPAIINVTPEEDEYDHLGAYACNVVTRSGEIETLPCFRQLPFICKVESKEAPFDPHCDVYAKDYHYNATLGSCYKVPSMIGSWSEGYAECRAEGSHLVILNSETERAAVQQILLNTPKVDGAKTSWFFFAGFRANKPVGNETLVFKTIFNQTLEEAGFAGWSPNEPNNALGNEFCGTIFKNDGKLNDVDCAHEYAFICEKEIEHK